MTNQPRHQRIVPTRRTGRGGTLLLAAVLALVVTACTNEEAKSASTSTTTEPPPLVSVPTSSSTAPALPDDAPRHDGSYLPASELAALLDCPDAPPTPEEEVPIVRGEPLPANARDCYIPEGFAQVREYADQADLDAALGANEPFCATVVVGERWIAGGNTTAAATYIQGVLGGRIVTFPGCEAHG